MDILQTALLEMCRKRRNIFFYPEDIIREMFPEDWRHFLPELESLINSLYKRGVIEVEETFNKSLISINEKNSVKIRCIAKPKS
ncbi:hypothetical protein AAGF08_07685 [Algoriphagus sp. SE2]|uniref:hypothetical protein n=1 Tax=Algoriphagus sp. SE2 TaxID=3141536 RepID=UPI0031CD9165